MTESIQAGKTTIALDVLITIARLTTLKIPGVSRLTPASTGVNRLFKRGQLNEGVVIEVRDDTVYADLYIALNNNVNIREVSRNIQTEVAEAISEMVGMQVGYINIHIEDIDYPEENSEESQNL